MSTQVLHPRPGETTLAIGSLLAGKYRVERTLGEGGMGMVLAAVDEALDRRVAVKVIRAELVDNASVVERLINEAKSVAKIQSEHVARVLDVGTLDNGTPFIVMEYLEGQDLGARLESHGALDIDLAVGWVLQVCEAVAEAHSRKIVHRDLKPENIFAALRPDGGITMKVLDFGISKQLGPADSKKLTRTSTSVGSPQYMSPEQMRAEPVDERADIWALGSLLYELLANRPPFEGNTVPEVCAKVLGEDPPALSGWAPTVPKLLEEHIHRCLAKRRDDRFDSVAAFAEAVAPFGGGEARRSWERIHGVTHSGRSAVDHHPLPFAETCKPGETQGAEVESMFYAATTSNPVSSTLGERSARPRWPWYALGAASIGLAGALFMLQQGGGMSDEGTPTATGPTKEDKAGGVSSAAATAANDDTARASRGAAAVPADPLAETDVTAAPTPAASAPAASAPVPPPPDTANEGPVVAPKRPRVLAPAASKAAKPAASSSAMTAPPSSAAPSKGDPWDTRNYGGRN